MIRIFGLNNGNRRGAIVIQHIIGKFGPATSRKVTFHVDFAVREFYRCLHSNVFHRPAFFENGWRDKAQFDIFFG